MLANNISRIMYYFMMQNKEETRQTREKCGISTATPYKDNFR